MVTRDSILHPVSWPMGFAWRSFMAQSTSLHKCFAGRLKLNQALSDDHIAPFRTRLNFALATDDRIVFGRGDQRPVQHRIDRVDKAIADAGIIAHPGKNVDKQFSETAIGVDLCSGKFLAPHAKKTSTLVLGLTHVIGAQPLANTNDLQAAVGDLTWFAMLNGLAFSCFDDILDETNKLGEARTVVIIGDSVLDLCACRCALLNNEFSQRNARMLLVSFRAAISDSKKLYLVGRADDLSKSSFASTTNVWKNFGRVHPKVHKTLCLAYTGAHHT